MNSNPMLWRCITVMFSHSQVTTNYEWTLVLKLHYPLKSIIIIIIREMHQFRCVKNVNWHVITHGRWGGGLLACLPPPGQKVNVTGIQTPESKSKLITYRYRQTPPGFFPQPTYGQNHNKLINVFLNCNKAKFEKIWLNWFVKNRLKSKEWT